MDVSNIIWSFCILAILALYTDYYSRKHNLNIKIALFIYLIHFSVTIAYYYSTLVTSADSLMFYEKSLQTGNIFDNVGFGTGSIIQINYIIYNIFNFSYFNSFLFFSSFGLAGFLKLFNILNFIDIYNIKFFKIRLIYIIVLLPQFHYWTCSLGKDSLTFFASMLILESLILKNKFNISTFIGLVIFFFVRTYMLIFMIIAYLFTIVFSKKINLGYKFLFISIFIIIFLILKEQILLYFKVDNFDIQSIEYRTNKYSDYAEGKAGSYIDPASMSYPSLIFAYLFRPLFFDAKSITQLLSSCENLFFLYFGLRFMKLQYFKEIMLNKTLFFLACFSLINILIKSLSLYNLGLAARQRYMIIPYVVISVYYYIYTYHKDNNVQKK